MMASSGDDGDMVMAPSDDEEDMVMAPSGDDNGYTVLASPWFVQR